MREIIFFILILLFPNFCFAQKEFNLTKSSDNDIILDGIISEDEKRNSKIATIDFEQEPGDNIPTKLQSEVFITYTDTFIYFGVKAYGNPENIRGQIKPRDEADYANEDMIFLRLDPFGDSRSNYILGSNAFGSQVDLRVKNATSEEDSFDSSYNAVFETKSSVVDDGYILEFKVPINSLPYPPGKNQIWNFNISRVFTLNGTFYRSQTQPYDRSDPCWVCQVTDKLIMNDIVYKGKTELLPYVSSNISGQRQTVYTDPIEYGKIKGDVGIGLNYDFSPSSSIEATINPDFSQIEADRTQIDINSSFALDYPELRPFFNKGMDLLKFMDRGFYSRTINSPSFSSKFVNLGKKSGTILLSAVDEVSPYLVGGEDKSYSGSGGISYVNSFRHQRLINDVSKYGIFTTNRYYKEGGYGNLIGIDGLFTFNTIWRFQFEFSKNFNKEPVANWIESEETFLDKTVKLDGEEFKGSASYIRLSRDTEHWNTNIFYKGISPGFRADVGFVPRINRRLVSIYHGYEAFYDKKYLKEFSTSLRGDISYNYDNKLKAKNFDFNISIKTFEKIEIAYVYEYNLIRNYLNVDFKNYGMSGLGIIGFPTENLTFLFEGRIGKEIAFNEDVPKIGRQENIFLSLSYKVGNNINLNSSINYSRLENLDNKKAIYDGYISRLSLRYQFNNDLSLRLVSEYNKFNDTFLFQPLLKWNPNPSTIFYIGGIQNSINNFDLEPEDFDPFRVNTSQFFLKFQYLIGI
ncbi:carbohydrate binding family 9 domain-containing protein [Flavobacteriaceae bacterium]|nr:carbohydrate binding family 9 domain-containing protein [Flavobacteriaceae bacterium]